MQELTEKLERTQRERGRTLIKLEEERRLKRDHLKAAQVRQANVRPAPPESGNSCEVRFALQSPLSTEPVAAIYLVTASSDEMKLRFKTPHSDCIEVFLALFRQNLHAATAKRQGDLANAAGDLSRRSEEREEASVELEPRVEAMQENVAELQ